MIRTTPIVIALALFCLQAAAQGSREITLAKEPVAYHPKEFYISEVVDDLAEKGTAGTVTEGDKKDKLVFKGGAVEIINELLREQKPGKRKQPVILHLSKSAIEIKKEGDMWKVSSAITFSYYLGSTKLIDYHGKSQGEIPTDPLEYVSNYMKSALETNMKKFDTWWPDNQGKYTTTAAVKVNVNIESSAGQPGLMLYSRKRLLTIADFEGKPNAGVPEMATTNSGINLSYKSHTEDGQLIVDVNIVPYFNRKQSWFKPAAAKGKVLQHEQTHFDLTAVKACELATSIKDTSLTIANYMDVIKDLQELSTKALAQEQDLYDSETNHGTIPNKQDEWEKKTKARLKETGCY